MAGKGKGKKGKKGEGKKKEEEIGVEGNVDHMSNDELSKALQALKDKRERANMLI